MNYPKGRPSHAKELYYIFCIVLFVVITMFSVWGPGGYMEMKRVHQELGAQRMRVEALKRSNQEKLRSIQALRSDKATLERLARQNGYGKEGELIKQLPEEAKPQSDRR